MCLLYVNGKFSQIWSHLTKYRFVVIGSLYNMPTEMGFVADLPTDRNLVLFDFKIQCQTFYAYMHF